MFSTIIFKIVNSLQFNQICYNMSAKKKLRVDSKVSNDFSKGKKRPQGFENYKGKGINEREIIGKSEISLKADESNQEIPRGRSLSKTPLNEKPAGLADDQKLCAFTACSPLLVSPERVKKISYDEYYSKNPKKRQLSSSSKKITIPEQSPDLRGKKFCKFSQVSQDSNEEKLTVLSKYKISQPKNLKFSKDKRKDSLSSTLHKDADQFSNRLKIPLEPRKKSKKNISVKREDEVQRPISQLPRGSIGNQPNKLPEPNTKQTKTKPSEKIKFYSNRSKPKLSAKGLTTKSKKPSEENLLKEKVIPGILKVKKARFETYRQNSDINEKLESKNTDSKSSLSLSESAEWVNLDCKQFVAKPSELVGEFLKKLSDEKQIEILKANSEASKKSSYFEQPSGSSYCDSVNLVSDELPVVTEKKHQNVPPLQLMLLHNKKTSDSSRYCEEDGRVFDSKDSIFKGLISGESKISGNRSARQVIRLKKLPSK